MSVLLVVNTPPYGCRGTCCAARGLAEDQFVAHARVGIIHDLAEATVRCDRVLFF
jgi:sulfur relay (sulfurtransferase) complex TusBCD TusD component (DsrE family)